MLDRAKHTYRRLMLELATRRNNEHVGSRMGGDPVRYLSMLALTPSFEENEGSMFSVVGDTLHINMKPFTEAKFVDVRKALIETLTPELTDKLAHPEFVNYIEKCVNPTSPAEDITVCAKQQDLLNGLRLAEKVKELIPKEWGMQPKPLIECSSEFQEACKALCSFDYWTILVVFRVAIGIEFMVQYNLDEADAFADVLNKINSAVEIEV